METVRIGRPNDKALQQIGYFCTNDCQDNFNSQYISRNPNKWKQLKPLEFFSQQNTNCGVMIQMTFHIFVHYAHTVSSQQ